jgi:hypothetical protein
VLENVNPEIDRNGYHRHYDNQDDEQWRYFCFSTPDNIKLNSICDSNDDGSDNKRTHKEVDHSFTPCASVLIFDSKTVSLQFVCLAEYFANTSHIVIKVLRQRMLVVLPVNSAE